MDEFDFGIILPFYFKGDILNTDKIIFSVKKKLNSKDIVVKKEAMELEKQDEKCVFHLIFSEEESHQLPAGKYIWTIKQSRGEEMLNTVVNDGEFEVRKGVKV